MMKQKKVKTRKIRLGTISGDLAEEISRTLENEGVLMYQWVGPRIIDLYKEEYK
jgi:hypothetical protein